MKANSAGARVSDVMPVTSGSSQFRIKSVNSPGADIIAILTASSSNKRDSNGAHSEQNLAKSGMAVAGSSNGVEQPFFADGFESVDAEICSNNIDDDEDGWIDCDDFDCEGVQPCGPEQCDNGTDDDGDGYVDCDDFDCEGVQPCGPEQCDNGTDDDGDGWVDCDDFDCEGVQPCGPEQCDNGTDDDGDGFVDCDDFDCKGDPSCP